MFESNKEYTNRYRDTYRWTPKEDNTYLFEMDGNSMVYVRMGGREDVKGIDMSNLGMFDPSGGPYISLGMKVDGKPITRISSTEDGMLVEVGHADN